MDATAAQWEWEGRSLAVTWLFRTVLGKEGEHDLENGGSDGGGEERLCKKNSSYCGAIMLL